MSSLAIRQRRLVFAMLGTVIAVIITAFWDEEREANDALDALSHAQSLLAQSVAMSVATTHDIARAHALEAPGEVVILASSGQTWRTGSGHLIVSKRLNDAAKAGMPAVIVPREESVTFGLPRRSAIAAVAKVDDGHVAVVSTAQRERNRQRHSRTRLVAGVLLVSVIVIGFGSVGLREQRRELTRERDAQLSRADKMATIAALAGGVAHEIATPLAVIASRAEQLEHVVPSTERGKVDIISEQARRIEQVMRGFLSLSRGQGPAAIAVDCASLVNTAVQLVEHRFAAAHVTLEVAIAPDMPPLLGDASLLEHAMVNLLLNACEASPDGAAVRVCAHSNHEGVIITVSDRGHGIDASVATRVKEPFVTTKSQGTGLGLAITNEVVSHHGGQLHLRSGQGGVGTDAIIVLPPMKRAS